MMRSVSRSLSFSWFIVFYSYGVMHCMFTHELAQGGGVNGLASSITIDEQL